MSNIWVKWQNVLWGHITLQVFRSMKRHNLCLYLPLAFSVALRRVLRFGMNREYWPLKSTSTLSATAATVVQSCSRTMKGPVDWRCCSRTRPSFWHKGSRYGMITSFGASSIKFTKAAPAWVRTRHILSSRTGTRLKIMY